MSNYAVEMLGITKAFPGVLANDNVNFSVKENEIHALLGENGAGKSTLMSILFGAYSPDSGQILLHGKPCEIKNPNQASNLGIGMVHQHFKLVHNYTVTENIVLGIEPVNKWGVVDMNSAEKKIKKLSEQYGLSVDPTAKIDDISVGMQQRVEILKTLYRDADLLIFDEPSAVLTPQEIDELMEILKRLKSEGKTIILITHKLKEIKAVADRCTVLRRGKYIGTVNVADVSESELAEMMVGRSVQFNIDKKTSVPKNVVLELSHVCVDTNLGVRAVDDLSLSVRSGEIVGVAGVDGNGQTELIYAITGMLPVVSGKILLDGKDITHLSIKERIKLGVGHIPEDRHRHGLVLDFSVAENSILKNFDTEYTNSFGIINQEKMIEHGNKLIDLFDIRAGEKAATIAGSMSGGNQQKLIVARELDMFPKLLVVAQPTRGLDVGAIEYIRKRIIEERDSGQAVLLLSLELDEIMNLCDRIATISHGKILGVFESGSVTERDIGTMMAGVKNNKENLEKVN